MLNYARDPTSSRSSSPSILNAALCLDALLVGVLHLAHLGHPVFGDAEYGGRRGPLQRLAPRRRAQIALILAELDHQALHAETIAFRHPVTGLPMEFTAPVPPDFAAALEALACGS